MTGRTGADRAHAVESQPERRALAVSSGSLMESAGALAMQSRAGNRAVSSVLTNLGSGRPMPAGLRQEMEARFEHDFHQVRLHDTGLAASVANELSADALTIGHDVLFNHGRFDSESTGGRWLLAHELAHVIQQSRGGSAPPLDARAPHEHAANAAATQLLSGTGPVTVSGATGVGIARAGSGQANAAAPPSIHTPLEIGEERVVKDLGGHTSVVSRPLADVTVIDTELEPGQKTIRADFQKGALPTQEHPFETDKSGFERLHAIGPLVGFESAHGILWGPWRVNHELQEFGIETELAHLRDQLPKGGKLLLRVVVQRELGTGKMAGFEFLKSISYHVSRQLPGEARPEPVLEQEIVIEHPQDPMSWVDYGEPRRLTTDPLKEVPGAKASRATSRARSDRRAPDIRLPQDEARARKVFAEAEKLRDSLRAKGGPGAIYGRRLNEVLKRLQSAERMTFSEMESLQQELEDIGESLSRISTAKNSKAQPAASTSKPAKKAAPPVPAKTSKAVEQAKAPEDVKPPQEAQETKPVEAPAKAAAPEKTAEKAIEAEPAAKPVETTTQEIVSGADAAHRSNRRTLETPSLLIDERIGRSEGGIAVADAAVLIADVEQALEREAVVRNARRAGSLRTLRWWLQRGVRPKARGVIDHWSLSLPVPDEYVNDLSEIVNRAAKGELDGIEVDRPTEAAQYSAFEAWVTTHIHTLGDLYYHFVTHLDSGVQWNLDEGRWEVVTWTWSDNFPANVFDTKEEDPRISAFMMDVEARIKAETSIGIKTRSDRGAISAEGPAARIVGVRRFRENGRFDRSLYDPEGMFVIMYRSQWTQRPPLFQVIDAPSVPADYVLVAGADLFTELNIQHFRAMYGRSVTQAPGGTVNAPPKFDRDRQFTGWKNIDIPVAFVKKEALE